MPKPTNTQELTARYLAVLHGKPEEQFFALLNAASHVHANRGEMTDPDWREKFCSSAMQFWNYMSPDDVSVLEPLADDKAPF